MSELSQRTIIVIDPLVLFRDCLVHSIRMSIENTEVLGFGSVTEWRGAGSWRQAVSVILICGDGRTGMSSVAKDVSVLSEAFPDTPTLLVSGFQSDQEVTDAIASGVRGCIPTSLSLNAALGAISLAHAGVFCGPPGFLGKLGQSSTRPHDVPREKAGNSLTEREIAVLVALQVGKSNKIIASELQMCANTVKVHVRHIMRKLKAKNRTEAAYLALANNLGAPTSGRGAGF